ncbi:MAG: orotidine-5'-phosphate decarboxylase [Firmicutes bacterium]|nr:orotidine-5'-phosphate decarboxylase [Bacillota bacterium]
MEDRIQQAREKIIVALDVASREQAFDLVKRLSGKVGAYKVGMQLYNSEGPDIVRDIQLLGGRVFIDLKFHDIPNTVAQTSRVMVRRQAFMFTLHASGGSKMMQAAQQALQEEAEKNGLPQPLSLAVTVLTSISQEDLRQEMGVDKPIAQHVAVLAKLAKQSGLAGVVCSPQEISAIRQTCGKDFLIVTPGVRPTWASADDQQRITTPAQAMQAGADYLVIGRPITKAEDPAAAADKIAREMAEA